MIDMFPELFYMTPEAPPMTIRPVEKHDVQQVIDIAFRELHWHRPDTILRRVCAAVDKNDNINMLVHATDTGVIQGFGCYGKQEFSKNVFGLFMAATHADYRGQGVGVNLIKARLQAIQGEAQGGDLVMVSTKRPSAFVSLGFSSRRVDDKIFIMERNVFTSEELAAQNKALKKQVSRFWRFLSPE